MSEATGLRAAKGKEVIPAVANITVEGSNFTVTSGPVHGEFFRPLAPGRYTVTVRGDGLIPTRTNVTIPVSGAGVVREFVLRPRRLPSGAQQKLAVVLTPAEQNRDNMLLLGGGILVLYGLWITHRRMVHRTFSSTRERSV